MDIQQAHINSIHPYANNPRNNETAIRKVAESIEQFGFQQPIVVDKDRVIIVGHTRWRAAQYLGLNEVPVLVADLTPEKARAYRVADNKTNELAEWDQALLEEELRQIVADDQQHYTGFTEEELKQVLGDYGSDHPADNPYTKKVDSPIYEPQGEQPTIDQLMNSERTDQLKQEIEQTSMPEEVKQFLLCAAERHRRFDYEQIAEYYCHAPKEIQALMEKSALVIIDIDQAIELGYVSLGKNLQEIYAQDYGKSHQE